MAKASFHYYRIGIQELLKAIGPDDPSYAKVLVYQQRLEENLTAADLFGETPSLQAERAQIIDSCNRFGLSVTGHSFYYFCGLPESQASPRARADELFREAIRYQLWGDLGYALQLYRLAQQLDPTYPRIDATIAAVERETQAPYVDPYGHVRAEDLVHPSEAWEGGPSYRMGRSPLSKATRLEIHIVAAIAVIAVIAILGLLILLYLWLRGMLG